MANLETPRRWLISWLALLGIAMVACSAAPEGKPGQAESVAVFTSGTLQPPPTRTLAPLPQLGPAPEIGNEQWINSETPLKLAGLRGKVVLVEFWTFGCINCQHVIPSLRQWYEEYAGDDFEMIGVHYPEFGYEEKYENVVAAVEQLEIRYPVAIDNEGVTWRAYQQRFWPTLYLVDKTGQLRYKHIGEGAYAETEAYIQALIAEPDPVE